VQLAGYDVHQFGGPHDDGADPGITECCDDGLIGERELTQFVLTDTGSTSKRAFTLPATGRRQ
jgi:hypothetical protein